MNSIVLTLHVTSGAIAILTGFITLIPRKGSRWHIIFGKVFYIAMIGMGGAGSVLALFSSYEPVNAVIGLFTVYLVITARLAASNSSGSNTIKEKVGTLISGTFLVVFSIMTFNAVQSGKSIVDGIYIEAFYLYCFLSALAFCLDLRVSIKGGVYGKQRLARHIWRMTLALFIATASFFLGQPQVFPESIQSSGALEVPVIISVSALFFWLIKVYVSKKFSMY